MCQESLVNYLSRTVSGIPEEDIRDFVLYSDHMKDQDSDESKHRTDNTFLISENIFKIDGNGTVVTNRIEEIDNALKNVRVADPAVGSGAFPLGMLNEIVKARSSLTEYMIIAKKTMATSKEQGYAFARNIRLDRTQYLLKKETIRNCIFASDIEPSAVDIAQLRLWLSLVIDDEINPDAKSELEGHRNPTPLPNLECNILCGNSLIDDFEGICLINPSSLTRTAKNGQQINLGQELYDNILDKLIAEQHDLFFCDNTEKKQKHLENIEYLKDQIIKHQLSGCSSEVLNRYEKSKHLASKPYILWQLDFARVFREKGGFDIVIGNPPYLESRNASFSEEFKDALQKKMKKLYGVNAGWFPRGADLLIFFFELSLRIISPSGINTFITQNSWLDTEFGKKFQDYLLNTTNVLAIIDSDYKYFESADINTVITFFEGNQGCNKQVLFARCHKNLRNYSLPANANSSFSEDDVSYKKLPADSKLLRDMKWGFVFTTDDRLFDVIALANSKGKNIDELRNTFSIGQGLNLSKKAIVTKAEAAEYGVDEIKLIPFYTSDEGGHYQWKECSHYIIDLQSLPENLQKKLHSKIELFDSSTTRKHPPVLMMPRGIGARQYCCTNNLIGYSSSFVDIYSEVEEPLRDDIMRLWLYCNSSLFWLIREIAGRKNLGGGMLKAEAVDIKPFAIYFNFTDISIIEDLYNQTENLTVKNVQEEINTELHQKIDALVFDFLDIDEDTRSYICNLLSAKVDDRYNKTKN